MNNGIAKSAVSSMRLFPGDVVVSSDSFYFYNLF